MGFLFLDFATSIVYRAEQADVDALEDVFSLGVQLLQLYADSIARLFRSPDEVNSWSNGIFGKVFQRRLANAARCAGENGDQTRPESRRDLGVGGSDFFQHDHCRVFCLDARL